MPKEFEIFVPDASDTKNALARTTHLAIGAHPDDLEIFAFHGISACFEAENLWFTGVTVCDGAGSPRAGDFARCSDDDMIRLRREEQLRAAKLGKYSAQILMNLKSSDVKSKNTEVLNKNLKTILESTKPTYIYTHNLADKHDTHVALALAVVKAVRESGIELKGFYGCEVWRDLDWLNDEKKICLPCSDREDLALDLCAVYKTQIAGGKRYDLATIGRRRANATFYESKNVDQESAVTFAMDYLPLLKENISISAYVKSLISDFERDVAQRISKWTT